MHHFHACTLSPCTPNDLRSWPLQRRDDEWQAGHIKGARHASFLPPCSFPSTVAPLLVGLDKGAEIVIVCLKTPRSIGAVKWLSQQGFTNARQLQGGMLAWRSARLPEVLE